MSRARVYVLFVLMLGGSALATTYSQSDPTDMLFTAAKVFLGTVADVTVTEEDGMPTTTVSFTIDRAFVGVPGVPGDAGGSGATDTTSGDPAGDGAGSGGDGGDVGDVADEPDDPADTAGAERVSLSFLGGEVPGGPRLTVAGFPRWETGEQVLVFAYDDGRLASPLVGVRQGLWRVGPSGLEDDDGAFLAVEADGRLLRSDMGAGLEAVLTAVTTLLEAGAPPGDASVAAAAEPATEAAAPTDAPASEEPGTAGAAEATDAPPDAEEATTEAAGETNRAADDADTTEGADDTVPTKTVQLAVDDRGGPLLLSEAVAEAADAWTAASDGIARFEVLDEADRVVRYGDEGRFGPDAWSLTLVWSMPDSSTRVEALLSPSVGDARRAVLLHELGVLLGLPEGDGGVMAYAVDAAASAPSTVDVAALRAQQRFVPEDLDQNGVVDFYDLEAFGRAYDSEGVNLAADFDGDGRVNDADLKRLEAAYSFTAPRETPPGP